jgi:hypothetical protein
MTSGNRVVAKSAILWSTSWPAFVRSSHSAIRVCLYVLVYSTKCRIVFCVKLTSIPKCAVIVVTEPASIFGTMSKFRVLRYGFGGHTPRNHIHDNLLLRIGPTRRESSISSVEIGYIASGASCCAFWFHIRNLEATDGEKAAN